MFHFPNTCDEAINYYKEALGAEVKEISYFCDSPPGSGMDESLPPNFVMHSEILLFDVLVAMTDGAEKRATGEHFTLGVLLDSAEEVASVFNKLADGGKVVEALAPQFWAELCGSVEDRFGVNWHICTKR
jgi:PhnB protein